MKVFCEVCLIPDPYEWVVKLRIDGLQVFEDQLLVQHSFVERQREAGVDELPVEKCLKRDRKRKQQTVHVLLSSDIHCLLIIFYIQASSTQNRLKLPTSQGLNDAVNAVRLDTDFTLCKWSQVVSSPSRWSVRWSRSRTGGPGWWLRPGWSANSSCFCQHTRTDSTWGSGLHGTTRRTTRCGQRGKKRREKMRSKRQFSPIFNKRQVLVCSVWCSLITGLIHHSRDPPLLWRWRRVSFSDRKVSEP